MRDDELIKKAVIPAAGLGMRLLPATYAQPKEMLPCGRIPTIQYVVEELVAAGVKDILIITGRTKRALEDHFDPDFAFLEKLENSGKKELLEEMSFFSTLKKSKVNIFFTRQAKPTGLADAIYLAKDFVEEEPFHVALGDTVIYTKPLGNCLHRLNQVHDKKKSSCTILLEKVKKEETQKYGIINGTKISEGIWQITDLIEKPAPDVAPSQLAICGRYIFTPQIFPAIDKTPKGIGNEKQITDSIKILLKEGAEIWGIEVDKNEERYDIGDPLTYAVSFIELSLHDPEIRKYLVPYLKNRVKTLD